MFCRALMKNKLPLPASYLPRYATRFPLSRPSVLRSSIVRFQSNLTPKEEPERIPMVQKKRQRKSKDEYVVFDGDGNDHFWNSPTFWWIMIGSGAIGLVYLLTHFEKAPVSGRRRFMAMSKKDEAKAGELAFKQIMSQYQDAILPPNHPASILVNKVAKRLIPHSGLKDLDWKVYVIEEPNDANAFVLMGGKIFVFTGLLPITRDEQGLAAVLAHEIAHLICSHGAERYSQIKLLFPFQAILSMFFNRDLGRFSRFFFEFGVLRPFSRQTESEADFVGLRLMAAACYDPRAAVSLWQRMSKDGNAQPPQFVSTHPSNETRIRQIEKWLPEAQHIREANCGHTPGFLEAFKIGW